MGAMSEKTLPSARFLFNLIAIAMLIVCISSMFLYHSPVNPIIPTSVFNLIVVNRPDSDVESMDSLALHETVSLVDDEIKVKETLMGSDQIAGAKDVANDMALVMVDRHTDRLDTAVSVNVKKNGCNPRQVVLRVYMYDLPPEFHFGLVGWKGGTNQIWPDVSKTGQIPSYPGGLNLQHSVEYWLTLDLLSSNVGEVVRPCSAVRVANPSQADVIFVPFFASLSYNRHSTKVGEKNTSSVNSMLQSRLVEFLMSRREWRRSKGKDHVLVAHHPNSMLYARKKLGAAIFVLADFGRYPPKLANLRKDVIAPYKHVVRSVSANSSAPFEQRPILAYFQGAIYRKDGGAVRQELFYLLKDEKDVQFKFGSVQRKGIREASQGMAASKFCMNIAGDTPSSNRLFDSIVSHCVPVIISDEIELPFEEVLDYSKFCIFVRASDATKPGFLLNLLRGIKKDEWTTMWDRLKEVAHYFEYQYPSQPEDAVDMIWHAIARKFSTVKAQARKRRYRVPK
ncbi:hypothetical protein Droror1_Dr00004642 [Drosera rotundifolia]